MLDTAHLEPMEDLAYRRLLDLYYSNESPIPLETQSVARRLRLVLDVVEKVLLEFFQHSESGWKHRRCDAEIASYKAMAERNRKNGKAGGRPKKTQRVTTGNPPESQPRTRTGNQELEPGTSDLPPSPQRGKRAKVAPADDEAWLKELEADQTYSRIPIRQELGKAQRWCQTNNRKASRPFFVNWINKALNDLPMNVSGLAVKPPDKHAAYNAETASVGKTREQACIF